MAIDRFHVAQFEAALPVHKTTGAPLWVFDCVNKGERVYRIKISDNVVIIIRSSIDHTGYAAEAGADSIRVWVADGTGKPLAGKLSKYITRVPGWDVRLTSQLKALYKVGLRVSQPCGCGAQRRYGVVKKEGPNKGKEFLTCSNNHFIFIKEQE